MSNQASEELREIFIDRMWNYFGIEDKSELAYFGTIYDQAVAPIIRTEKLKLLAEVRERVVGEDEKLDMGGSKEAVDRHNIAYDRNELRAEQLESLTKLEAEL